MRRVIKPYVVVYPNALSIRKGSLLSIIKEETHPDWKGWLWCQAEDGQTGWISQDYMNIDGKTAVMNQDYDAREVAVSDQEIVVVLKEEHGWCWVKKSDDTEGWVPSSHLEIIVN